MSEKPLMDIHEVADLFRISTRTVRRLSERGEFPKPVKLGALVRWSRVSIDNWVANGCPPVLAESSDEAQRDA